MKLPQWIGGSYESQSILADCERTINWYPELLQAQGATAKTVLYPTPGVTTLGTMDQVPGRAHFYMDGREFAVSGTNFVEIDSLGTAIYRGTVALDSNPATIRDCLSMSPVEVRAMMGRPLRLLPAPRMKSCKAPIPP